MRTVIEAGRSDQQYWRDLWRFRELLLTLAWRDVTVRYKQTVVGVAWVVVRPVVTAIILIAVFGRIAKLPAGGVAHYPLLVLSGMLGWQLFAGGFSGSSDSLLGNANLIRKVYFPRLVIPLSSLASSIVDFCVTLPMLVGLMLWYGSPVTWRLLFFPLFVLLTVMAALGIGLWLSALNVRFRDVRVLIPFALQFGMYVTPVGYSTAAVPEEYRTLYSLNPMVGIIEGFRWSLFGSTDGFSPLSLTIAIGAIAVLLVTGQRYFRRTERTFADFI